MSGRDIFEPTAALVSIIIAAVIQPCIFRRFAGVAPVNFI
jgi:hypothetical protein